MPNVDGFGAYIKIEDNRLDENKIESSSFRDNGHEDNVRVACHIASEAGKVSLSSNLSMCDND